MAGSGAGTDSRITRRIRRISAVIVRRRSIADHTEQRWIASTHNVRRSAAHGSAEMALVFRRPAPDDPTASPSPDSRRRGRSVSARRAPSTPWRSGDARRPGPSAITGRRSVARASCARLAAGQQPGLPSVTPRALAAARAAIRARAETRPGVRRRVVHGPLHAGAPAIDRVGCAPGLIAACLKLGARSVA